MGATRFEGPAGERWTYTASVPVTNLVARLGDYASGGQLLIASTTAGLVREQLKLQSLGAISLKDFAQSEQVWEVDGLRYLVGSAACHGPA